ERLMQPSPIAETSRPPRVRFCMVISLSDAGVFENPPGDAPVLSGKPRAPVRVRHYLRDRHSADEP
ncbi:MAG: hypothetical protein ACREEH_03615, partial [Caulobacteraceae bacterium]